MLSKIPYTESRSQIHNVNNNAQEKQKVQVFWTTKFSDISSKQGGINFVYTILKNEHILL